ncbi:YitT family protein [Desulfoluna sp.]|uniref:YitT family protein n=1 Tax=Desulfoluna sp. TaxID=2045199 RepID=UPI0026253130|nr:YitT family protein [Desulfoluna sp.]
MELFVMSDQTWIDSGKIVVKNVCLLTLGSCLSALSINGILIPNHFPSGGITGLSLLLHYQFTDLPFVLFYLMFNVPLFAVAWKYVGRRFFLYSIIGLTIFSLCVHFIRLPIPLHDKMLDALMAGILSGTGLAIILKSYGSSGGNDILSVILLKRFSIRLGNTSLAVNSLVVLLSYFLSTLDIILYTIVFLYVNAKVLNVVFMGMSQRKVVLIISDHWEKLSERMLKEFRRGLTIIHGEGAYSHRDEKILYAVITLRDLGRVKDIIRDVDPRAFVVVTETLDVMNPRVGNQPHW